MEHYKASGKRLVYLIWDCVQTVFSTHALNADIHGETQLQPLVRIWLCCAILCVIISHPPFWPISFIVLSYHLIRKVGTLAYGADEVHPVSYALPGAVVGGLYTMTGKEAPCKNASHYDYFNQPHWLHVYMAWEEAQKASANICCFYAQPYDCHSFWKYCGHLSGMHIICPLLSKRTSSSVGYFNDDGFLLLTVFLGSWRTKALGVVFGTVGGLATFLLTAKPTHSY